MGIKYEKEGEIIEISHMIGELFLFKGDRIWTIILNGKEVPHREEGPACIVYDCDGKVKCEQYYINGKRHREDGGGMYWV